MNVQGVETLLAEHPIFKDLDPPYLELIAGCASNVRFEAGEQITREGAPAERFYLIRFGKVAIEVFAPGKGPVNILTVGEDGLVGWSWLYPPYRSHNDARALELTRAIAFDGACLRGKIENDPKLGYELMTRFSQVVFERLRGAELQLLDVYGDARSA